MMQVDLGFESRNLLIVRISTAGSVRTRDGASRRDRSGARALHAHPRCASRCRTFGFPCGRSPCARSVPCRPRARRSTPWDPTTSRCSGFVWWRVERSSVDDRSRPTPVAVVNQNLARCALAGPGRCRARRCCSVLNGRASRSSALSPTHSWRASIPSVPIRSRTTSSCRSSHLPCGPAARWPVIPCGPRPRRVTLYVRHRGDVGTVAGAVGPALREVDRAHRDHVRAHHGRTARVAHTVGEHDRPSASDLLGRLAGHRRDRTIRGRGLQHAPAYPRVRRAHRARRLGGSGARRRAARRAGPDLHWPGMRAWR